MPNVGIKKKNLVFRKYAETFPVNKRCQLCRRESRESQSLWIVGLRREEQMNYSENEVCRKLKLEK